MEIGLYDTIIGIAWMAFTLAFLYLILKEGPRSRTGINPVKREPPERLEVENLTNPPINYTTWEVRSPSLDESWKGVEELWEGLAKHCPSPEEIEEMTGDEAYEAFLDCLEKYKEEHDLVEEANKV